MMIQPEAKETSTPHEQVLAAIISEASLDTGGLLYTQYPNVKAAQQHSPRSPYIEIPR
jgi:hypothetical protein